MEKEILEKFISEKLSIRQISLKTERSFTTIRYWIKKHGLKPSFDQFNPVEYGEKRFCPKCKLEKSTANFYKRRNKKFSSSYCRSCTNATTSERVKKFKVKCVEYKGGECFICGYKKCYSALEFHHINPETKDSSIAHMRKFSFDDIVKYELDKCVLLCANCHREVESGLTDLNL